MNARKTHLNNLHKPENVPARELRFGLTELDGYDFSSELNATETWH